MSPKRFSSDFLGQNLYGSIKFIAIFFIFPKGSMLKINHRFMLSCLIYLESAMKFVILAIVFTENVFQQKII
jgi:hypothetical protein